MPWKRNLNRSRQMVSVASLAACASIGVAANAAPVNTVFVVAMENHNWTQPVATSSPQQILGNAAAPYINSLLVPNTTASAQVSYASNYYNSGTGVHPSEPNYVWAEAGTDFGVHTDADPSAASNNIFTAPHLTSLMNSAGVTWNNYQEDSQYATGPTHSASGTGGTAPSGAAVANNPNYGTAQYNYAVKHNPMAFFSDTGTQNVKTFSQLSSDIAGNSFAKYNWITPNQYNDMHSSLSTDFSYNNATWTHGTDQQAIAIGDSYLSKIIPQIQATQAYQNNGAIVIWFDESENGDGTDRTLGEIVLSPLAKGNGYNSTVTLSHSSDIKTLQEIYGLGPSYLNNTIPSGETGATGGLYTVSSVNDLSDLFKAGTIPTSVPEPTSLGLIGLIATGLLKRRRKV